MIKLKYIFILIGVLLSLIIIFFVIGNKNESQYLLIKEPTKVFEKPDWFDELDNKVLFVLNNGDKVLIKKVIYKKDFKFYKIRTNEGSEGYIIHDNTLEVISN